ncbi:MAG TPA: S24 family peptidase [Methylotenera sp.]|nr:S24 family peptidase [Methylotenera sp.]
MPIVLNPALPDGAIAVSLNPPPLTLPIYAGKVSAAQSRWASAAQDYIDDDSGVLGGRLDLNAKFISNPPSTFLMPMDGYSQVMRGIYPGTYAIIDKSTDVKNGRLVVVWYGDKYILKEFHRIGNIVKLRSAHPDRKTYRSIIYKDDDVLLIWGVMRYGINEY